MSERVILCVDDEELILKTLKRELHEGLGEDYFVETVESGDDALEIVEELISSKEDLPLVIADQIMPEMRGDELLRRIHVLSPNSLKIMLTGQADMQAVADAVNFANLYRYISKPWEHTDFLLTVKEALHTYEQAKLVEEQRRVLQRLYAQAQDEIGERKRIEAALRKREASLQAILDTAADGIITLDASAHIQTFNQAAERMFGYAEDEVLGQRFERLFMAHEALRGGTLREMRQEVIGRKKLGEIFPAELAVSELRLPDQHLFISLARDLSEQKRAEEERIELSAIQRELSIAQDIQQSLLLPSRPDWRELDVICYSTPAREVGGDFYSYHTFEGEPKRFALAVGDVSGKGVSAALLMSVVLSQFNASLTLPLRPAKRLAHLNASLLPYTKQRYQNCALCYVEIELGDVSRLHAVNAGCIPPLIKRRRGEIELLEISGLPLGIGFEENMDYQAATVLLHPGDCVLLTSDGVIEASNANDELFGFQRLEKAFADAPMTDAYAILKHFQAVLREFVGECAPHDDLTMIVAQISAGKNT